MKRTFIAVGVCAALFAAVILFFSAPKFLRAANSLAALLSSEASGSRDEILEINDRVQEHKKKINDLSSRIEEYQKKIETKRKESASLENQLQILENRIAKTELEIDEAGEEIETTELEIQALGLEIEEKEAQIKRVSSQVAEGIRAIDRADARNKLELLFLGGSFSEFFQEVAELEGVYSKLGEAAGKLQNLRSELVLRREIANGKKESLEKLKAKLEASRASLVEAEQGKEVLLTDAKQTARRFQGMVAELRQEQAEIDDELSALEGALRERLKNSELALSPDAVILSWPVDPGRGITTYFHDPEYPFRYVFEHAGLDIRASQRTPVKAAAAGYVARVKNGGRGYSYIMLVHGGNVSTVYGHLSGFAVTQDKFVERGTVIGYSGGAPGTPGAGYLTTGPHLHFEVRRDGVPVDPFKYLLR